ncbi:MAG: hypothetical protein AAGI17_09305 [Planctomycetota bacterium]
MAEASRPNRLRQATITFIGAWPTITILLYALNPLIGDWPMPLQTALLALLMVIALTWLVIPGLMWLAQRLGV